jgi:dTMP kinase
VEPDLTILIDMDPAQGLSRSLSRPTPDLRFEGFGEDLQTAMRAGFLKLAEEFSARFVVVDGGREVEVVARDVVRSLVERVG